MSRKTASHHVSTSSPSSTCATGPRRPPTPSRRSRDRESGSCPMLTGRSAIAHRAMTTSTDPRHRTCTAPNAPSPSRSPSRPPRSTRRRSSRRSSPSGRRSSCDAAGVARGPDVSSTSPAGPGSSPAPPPTSSAPTGRVVGLDLNEAMLTVAGAVSAPTSSGAQGDAASLPFDDESFDAVLCQMALMFFPDRDRGARRDGPGGAPGGTVAVAVPAALDAQPAFAPFVDMAGRHAGPEATSLLEHLLRVRRPRRARATLRALPGSRSRARAPTPARTGAPSVDALVTTEVESTPLGERITDDVYRRIRDEAHECSHRSPPPTAASTAPFDSHVVVARRPTCRAASQASSASRKRRDRGVELLGCFDVGEVADAGEHDELGAAASARASRAATGSGERWSSSP